MISYLESHVFKHFNFCRSEAFLLPGHPDASEKAKIFKNIVWQPFWISHVQMWPLIKIICTQEKKCRNRKEWIKVIIVYLFFHNNNQKILHRNSKLLSNLPEEKKSPTRMMTKLSKRSAVKRQQLSRKTCLHCVQYAHTDTIQIILMRQRMFAYCSIQC